jgi:hypothetical protein
MTLLDLVAQALDLARIHGNGPVYWVDHETGERCAVQLTPAIAKEGIYVAIAPLGLPQTQETP